MLQLLDGCYIPIVESITTVLYLELMLQLLDGCWTHHTVPVAVVLHVELRLGERLHAQRLAQRLQHTTIILTSGKYNNPTQA